MREDCHGGTEGTEKKVTGEERGRYIEGKRKCEVARIPPLPADKKRRLSGRDNSTMVR